MNTPGSYLRNIAYNGSVPEAQRLLLEGVDPNVRDEWGRTALSLAAGQGHVEMVRVLLAGGAWVDPHEDYDTYETPLMVAAENGHLEIVKLLVEAGANPFYHVGVAQRTAESYARSNGHSDIVAYLASLPRK